MLAPGLLSLYTEIMPGASELQGRFHLAVEHIVNRAIQQCDFAPDSCLRMISEHGEVQSAKRLLAEPVSDDSLQLWARGKPELTIEAIAHCDEWWELFSVEEREVAQLRCAHWSLTPLLDEIVAGVLAEVGHPLYRDEEIDWGE
jgi:hypothetical protein